MTMTRPDAAPRAFDEQHRTITVGLLALVTMFAFEAVAVSLAMPSVARDLGGETLYPIAVIGMLTAAIVGMVIGGIWGDARGASLPVTRGRHRLRGRAPGLRVRRLDGGPRRRSAAAGSRRRSRADGAVRRRRRRLPAAPAHAHVLVVRHGLGGAVDRRPVRRRRAGRPLRLALGVPGRRGLRSRQHPRRTTADVAPPGRPHEAARVGPPSAVRRRSPRSGSSRCTWPATAPASGQRCCSWPGCWSSRSPPVPCFPAGPPARAADFRR